MAQFVAHMEAVLETYEKAYKYSQPVVCMDEQPVQLLKETSETIPATVEHPAFNIKTNTNRRDGRHLMFTSRSPVFAKPRPVRTARRWSWRWKWRPCSTPATRPQTGQIGL